MTDTTLAILHNAYENAINSAESIVGVLRFLKESLDKQHGLVPSEDLPIFNSFLDGVDTCIHYRMNTSDITDMLTFVTTTMLYIVRWMNTLRDIPLDADIFSRRKSLESNLTKILTKSCKDPSISPPQDDIFGMRVILLNDLPYEDATKCLYELYHTFNDILGGKDPQKKKAFWQWCEEFHILPPVKAIIQDVLATPFQIESKTDYVQNPKPNGYQSIHSIYRFAFFHPFEVLRGIPFELQLRTLDMDYNAEYGPAAHKNYKGEIDRKIAKVFELDDYSKAQIPGLTNDLDYDGVKKEKEEGKKYYIRRTLMTN